MELKSLTLQKLLVEKISDIIQDEDSLKIQTPSFIFNVYKLYSNNLPKGLSIEKSFFKLPSFCSLTNRNECDNQEITIKVN